MSNVIPFAPRSEIAIDLTKIAAPPLDHRKWECGSCHVSCTFHIWCDGVVACAECGVETLGMKATVDEPK